MQRLRYLMGGLGLLLMVGIHQGCVIPPPNITCDTMEYQVLPGETKDVLNPCEFAPGIGSSGRWAPKDTFELAFLPIGVRLDRVVDKNTGKVTRKLVAEPTGVQHVEKRQASYKYVNGGFSSPPDAFLTISTVPPLEVSLIADPPTITAGQPSQLSATVTGGVPPYLYSWTEDSSFHCIPQPAAGRCESNTASVRPATTSTYLVSVVDEALFRAEASVIVNVSGSSGPSSFLLTVAVNPRVFNLFVSSADRQISCFNGFNCSALFPARTNVTLTAETPPNSVSWVGCDFLNLQLTQCTVFMNADRTVTVFP